MCCLIIGKSVAADLSATSTMNASLVPLSIPRNTQCPSLYRLWLYFLLPNFGFIDFDYCSWTTNLYWMVDEVLGTYMEIKPVHNGPSGMTCLMNYIGNGVSP